MSIASGHESVYSGAASHAGQRRCPPQPRTELDVTARWGVAGGGRRALSDFPTSSPGRSPPALAPDGPPRRLADRCSRLIDQPPCSVRPSHSPDAIPMTLPPLLRILAPSLAVLAALPLPGHRPRRFAAEPVHGLRRPGEGAAGQDDPGREDRPDDSARSGIAERPLRHREVFPRFPAQRRRVRPQEKGGLHAPGLDRHGGRLPEARAQDAPRHPTAVRRGRGPRAQQRPRRRRLPAPDRPRLHAGRGARGEGRACHGGGGPRHRHQLGLRAVRDRAAGRTLGPDLRGLLGGPAARAGTRRGGGARLPGGEAVRPAFGPRLRQALRRRRRHGLRLHQARR